MSRTAARKDTNHNEIADAFQRCGWYWKDTYQLGLWVNVIIEIKAPGGRLTPAEQEFHEIWPGPVEVVTSLDDVLAVNEKYARPDWYYIDPYCRGRAL